MHDKSKMLKVQPRGKWKMDGRKPGEEEYQKH